MKGDALRLRIYEYIELNWPVHTKQIAKGIGLDTENSSIKKVSYHMKKLEKDEKIITKRIGRAVVAWPYDIERLRTIHELLMT